ncbi:hypothetical protein ACNRWW_15295 [Metabacillus sp. HB246100]
MKNEKGQTLLTVMVVSLIFTVLGLTIVAASINSNERTGVRIDEVELTTNATKVLNEGIAKFTKSINSLELNKINLSSLDSQIAQEITKLNSDITVTDISAEEPFNIDTTKYYTRIFELSYKVQNDGDRAHIARVIKRKVYLSPTPSFLNYAIGSGPDGKVYLNGASYVKGDVFSGDLYTSNIAQYEDVNKEKINQQNTLYPRVDGNIYLKKSLNNVSLPLSINEYKDDFHTDSNNLTVNLDLSEFVHVNFPGTMSQVFNRLSTGFQDDMFSTPTNVHLAIEQLITNCKNGVASTCNQTAELLPISPLLESPNYSALVSKLTSSNAKTYIYYANNSGAIIDPLKVPTPPLFIEQDVKMANDSWLIVHGDLIVRPINKTIILQGNIIVTGDLIISGDEENNQTTENDNLSVDSTIYVLGQSEISNTNINGYEKKQLVLLSKEQLLVNRINEFKENDGNIEKLDAFFYTEKSAELYGVGSLFLIEGGIFARDNLTINSIKQNEIKKSFNSAGTINLKNSIDPTSLQNRSSEKSRFQVEHNLKVLADQIDALPRVDHYLVILDEPTIENATYDESATTP